MQWPVINRHGQKNSVPKLCPIGRRTQPLTSASTHIISLSGLYFFFSSIFLLVINFLEIFVAGLAGIGDGGIWHCSSHQIWRFGYWSSGTPVSFLLDLGDFRILIVRSLERTILHGQ